jgi:protein ImuB
MFAALITPGRPCPSLESFSPRSERVDEHTILVDLQGLQRLWPSWRELAEAIEEYSKLGKFLPGNVTIAPTPSLAIQVCQFYEGVQIVSPGDEESFLLGLPIDVLPVAESTKDTLAGWGIFKLEQLVRLPENDLLERLGQEAALARNWAIGQTRRLFQPQVTERTYTAAMALEEGVENLQALEFVIARLLLDLCRDVASNGLAINELQMELHLSSQVDFRVLRFPQSLIDTKSIQKLTMLELQARKPRSSISKVQLTAIPGAKRYEQQDFFEPTRPTAEQWQVTLARIAQLVGAKNMGSVRIVDTHRPDSWEWIPFEPPTEKRTDKNSKSDEEMDAEEETRAVIRRFRPPLPARVELRDGRPVFLEANWIKARVLRCGGPWHSSGDWWRMDGSDWRITEWDVETKTMIYRIHCSYENRWYVDGYYD